MGALMRRVAVPCEKEAPAWPGHRPDCFRFFDVCAHSGRVLSEEAHCDFPADAAELAEWLDEEGVDCVLATRVDDLLRRDLVERGVAVIAGQFGTSARAIVAHHLGRLAASGENILDYAARYR